MAKAKHALIEVGQRVSAHVGRWWRDGVVVGIDGVDYLVRLDDGEQLYTCTKSQVVAEISEAEIAAACRKIRESKCEVLTHEEDE